VMPPMNMPPMNMPMWRTYAARVDRPGRDSWRFRRHAASCPCPLARRKLIAAACAAILWWKIASG